MFGLLVIYQALVDIKRQQLELEELQQYQVLSIFLELQSHLRERDASFMLLQLGYSSPGKLLFARIIPLKV